MIIKQTQQAIKFFEGAIKNAQAQLEFQVNQDEKYQEFVAKYKKIGITTLFHSHSQEFEVYRYGDNDDTEHYFKISDGEIVVEDKWAISYLDTAEELLSIVGKFYE